MKNYRESDYALNKYSEGIVYKFADGNKQIIYLADYLAANPDKTAEDFAKLKAFSDEDYHEQVIVEHRTSRLDVTMNGLEETEHFCTASLDTDVIHKIDGQAAIKAMQLLMCSGKLTEVQRRRFILYYINGYSVRKIAQLEGVHKRAVWDSLQWATKKLKKFYIE